MTEFVSAAELLECGELVDIRVLRFSAGLREEIREDLEDDDVLQQLDVSLGSGKNTIEVRVRAKLDTRGAEYSAEVAMQYSYESDSEPTEEVIREFAERAGLAAVYPYVRELMQTNSMRLRQESITMPFLRLGSQNLDVNDGEEV